MKSKITGFGVYLPNNKELLSDRLERTKTRIRFPLGNVTGISEVHVADSEGSVQLALNAISACLESSSISVEEIDILIYCSISQSDMKEGALHHVLEPPISQILKQKSLMRPDVISFDINNACAGFHSGILIADKLLKSRSVNNILLVSGEHISPISQAAEIEIQSPKFDPQLGSLTVGDSGLAIILSQNHQDEEGFDFIDFYTLGDYSMACIGKQSEVLSLPIMINDPATHSDSFNNTLIEFLLSRDYSEQLISDWGQQTFIPHQASRVSINGAVKSIRAIIDPSYDSKKCINNLKLRGNTATTTQLLAMWDKINEGSINNGEKVVFGISGSGQTMGLSLYQLADLPSKIQEGKVSSSSNGITNDSINPEYGYIESLSFSEHNELESDQANPYLGQCVNAAKECIEKWGGDVKTIKYVVYNGVYRKDLVGEPAIASIIAGELNINSSADDFNPYQTTIAFDLTNGELGFLSAALASAILKNDEVMLVVSSESVPEHASPKLKDCLSESASAAIIKKHSDRSGFSHFQQRYLPDYEGKSVSVRMGLKKNRLEISGQRDPEIEARLVESMIDSIIEESCLTTDDIDQILLPFELEEYVHDRYKLGESLNRSDSSVGNHAYYSNATPSVLSSLLSEQTANKGRNILLISASRNGQILGCLYET